MGAAIALYLLFPDAKYIAANYGTTEIDPTDIEGQSVAVVDFSFDEKNMQLIFDKCSYLLWVDHHETAINRLQNWMHRTCDNPKVDYVVDMQRSAAALTWKHIHNYIPKLIEFVEDRDLWQSKFPQTRAVDLVLRSYGYDIKTWAQFFTKCGDKFIADTNKFLPKDNLLINWFDQQVNFLVSKAWPITLDGYNGYMVCCSPMFASDVGNKLAQLPNSQFGLSYVDTEHHRLYSIRSDSILINVARIAEKRGGGGHPKAAGFNQPLTPVVI